MPCCCLQFYRKENYIIPLNSVHKFRSILSYPFMKFNMQPDGNLMVQPHPVSIARIWKTQCRIYKCDHCIGGTPITTHSLQTIIEHYFPLPAVKTEPVPFGLTNTTCFVTVNDQKYVARHYDRYTMSAKSLPLEIEVTSFLLRSALSFAFPSFLPAQNGNLSVTLPDGTLGALVSYIQGSSPLLQTPDDAHAFGRVVGEVGAKLSEYRSSANNKYDGVPPTGPSRLVGLQLIIRRSPHYGGLRF